ncbi:putative CtpA-like serine protease [Roseimaritima multifibrata]|uniref:Putative CtpA-like serine protease n=1 Tax=Roseimaritima multifibrata TaxID=1930274 RepID=A0A517MEV4_9BACT|nr:S41 family peptidase [Roseimaritima multifibrata]QDS93423.1 putative CtpA-like serine protease [Roseimaritima multifibrata]
MKINLTSAMVAGLIAAALLLPSSARAESATVTAAPAQSTALEAMDGGIQLEKQREWGEAIRHYESALREHIDNPDLQQRLLICRLHFDVKRRYQDNSYLQAVRETSTQQALELYEEVLANLETHYVGSADWKRLVTNGTASLEVALTEPTFVDRLLANASPEQIETFRQNVHRHSLTRPATNRHDLRSTVAYVAGLARQDLGLAGSATVFEFVCGSIGTLDPYSRFLTPNQLEETFSNIEGNFVGLGIELKAEEKQLLIVNVIEGGPADSAGIQAGDRITRVEDSYTQSADPDFVADLLRGPENTFVSVTVETPGQEPRDVDVQRRRVEVPSVEDVRIVDEEHGIGYMRLTNFQKTTSRDFEAKLWDLHRQGMRQLIVDVRGNPGGLLTAAVEVADRFVSAGDIVRTRGRNARENYDYKSHRPNTWSVPLTVLIDGDSASASEIFAGAIADHDRGELVGERTYGKGSVQGIFRMQAARVGLCLTTAKFYSPNGTAISGHGVVPTVVQQKTYMAARPAADGHITTLAEDAVLQRAIQLGRDRAAQQ